MAKYKVALGSGIKALNPVGNSWAVSGDSDTNTTANYRVQIQNVEMMYTRVTQYKSIDGSPDFNYLDVNYTIEASREHIYLNASAGGLVQLQTLDLVSDSASGALGSSGVIRTSLAGMTRREVRAGDSENRTRATGNMVAGKTPGAYSELDGFDVSGNTNSTVLDMLITAKASCPDFEINLVDL